MSSGADRMRRRRELERAGKRVFALALNSELVDHALVAAGFVSAEEAPNPPQVTELLTVLVAEHLFSVTRNFQADDGLANDRAELIRKLSSDTKA